MDFNKKQLICISTLAAVADGAVSNKIYSYATNDDKTAVEANAYFDGALDNGLNVGDLIRAIMDFDGTLLFKDYIVTAGGADVAIRGEGLPITRLTDSSGGTASNTIAAIGGTYSQTEVRNAVASLAAKINELQAAITV